MPNFEMRYIVQDLESFEFLYPDPAGDIGLTPYIKLAGKFETRDDALTAGMDEIGEQFAVFAFWEAVES
ncbi:hypothetical protein [Neisseria shayeganii]|uniref:Phage associated protein n=1 Tax=Neisseria shayeganii 871 TaxID=1032488 RepID=G4CLK0_9NEIS|nr:hypothetical protein [Neisseria shayeganii]EGY51319.1 hypothetical protein HMPREF9371_2491 [Neisseria shayeganii 871]